MNYTDNILGDESVKKKQESGVYFTQETENAILEYLTSEDKVERDQIYSERIEYAFYKLAENIIHTFKFYYTDVNTIEELKHEVVTVLLEKLHLFTHGKGKAYSYFGTIAKNYLIVYNNNNYKKLQNRVDMEEVEEDTLYINEAVKIADNNINLSEFLDQYIKYLDKNIFKIFPKQQDAKVADAILELFRKRETLEIFNKKALYIYIREMTDVSTPHITKITKKLDTLRVKLYNEYYRNGFIRI